MLLAALLLAAAAPAAPIAPTGPWVVRAEENMCQLVRTYPVADGKVTLVFQPLLDLGTMELLTLTSDRSDRQYTGRFKAAIQPGTATYAGAYYSVSVPKTQLRLTRITLTRDALDQLKDGDTLHLQAKPVDLAFKIVRPENAREVLKTCIDDLKRSWGIDPDTAARAVTPVGGNPAHYFGPEAYPAEAIHQGIYGRVIALLNINTEGLVDHCRIVSSAGTALNEGTCKAASRIKFEPARDKDGKALPSTFILPVRWVLPGSPDDPSADSSSSNR